MGTWVGARGGPGGRGCCGRESPESDIEHSRWPGPGRRVTCREQRANGGDRVRARRECVAAARARSEWVVWLGPRATLPGDPCGSVPRVSMTRDTRDSAPRPERPTLQFSGPLVPAVSVGGHALPW